MRHQWVVSLYILSYELSVNPESALIVSLPFLLSNLQASSFYQTLRLIVCILRELLSQLEDGFPMSLKIQKRNFHENTHLSAFRPYFPLVTLYE